MKCPRCVLRIHRTAEQCPHCGFSLAVAMRDFGAEPPELRLGSDPAGLLRLQEKKLLDAAIERFGKKFPQYFFAVYCGAFREQEDLRCFGFWALNRAVWQDLPEGKRSDGGIMLVLDAERKLASITFGYALDPYLTEEDTFACLEQGHPEWLERRYLQGICDVIEATGEVLRSRCWKARWFTRSYAKRVQAPASTKGGRK